jgi:hypothetical protein
MSRYRETAKRIGEKNLINTTETESLLSLMGRTDRLTWLLRDYLNKKALYDYQDHEAEEIPPGFAAARSAMLHADLRFIDELKKEPDAMFYIASPEICDQAPESFQIKTLNCRVTGNGFLSGTGVIDVVAVM